MPSTNPFLNALSDTFVTFIDVFIGHTSISSIGNGTISGAISALQSTKAPINHASQATGYGLGTSANYGHVKVIDNLTTSTARDGEALSAHQGYELDTRVKALENSGGGGGVQISISETEPSNPSNYFLWLGGS